MSGLEWDDTSLGCPLILTLSPITERVLNLVAVSGGPDNNGHMIMATHDPLLLAMPLLMVFKVSA